jgi:addiction module RelE/StbE family toxin
MAYQIKWTNAAKEEYHAIVSYLHDERGMSSAEIFTNELQNRLKYLEHFPLLGKQHSKLSSVRQLVIRKNIMLFYTVMDKNVIVLNVLRT